MKPNQSHVAGLQFALDTHIIGDLRARQQVEEIIRQAKSAPTEPDVERPISIPTALILWAGIEDESQPTQWHKGYEAARGYVNMQICSAIPTTKDHLAVAEPVSREEVGWLCTHSDGRKRIELPGCVYDQDAGWGASRVPLYTAPPSPDAELVELLRSKFPRIDPCKPVPLNEVDHCCEYVLYQERERLHKVIDAKLASLEVKA